MKKTVIVVLAACLCWQVNAFAGADIVVNLLAQLAVRGGELVAFTAVEEARKDEQQKEEERKRLERERTKMLYMTSDLWTPLRFGFGTITSTNAIPSIPWDRTNVYGLDTELCAIACDMAGAQVGAISAIAHDVYGVQIATFASDCVSFTGLQTCGMFAQVREDSYGLQASLLSDVNCIFGGQIACAAKAKVCRGFQLSVVGGGIAEGGVGIQIGGLGAGTEKDYAGLQVSSLLSGSDHIDGVQVTGLYSAAKVCNGLQVGLVTRAKSGHCVQIGLVNITEDRILPFFNWSWK